MTDLGEYARLYLCIPDDPKFAEVYDDDHHFATYCRLLMIAEAPWPASAHIPATAMRDSVEKLANVGLIDLQSGGRYRVHGLDAERERRSASARNAAAVRWQSARSAAPDATGVGAGMPSSATHSNATQRIPRESLPSDDGRDDLEAWLIVRHSPPSERQRAFLDTYCRVFDLTGPSRAAQLILRNPSDPIKALKADLDAFRKERADAIPPEPDTRKGPSLSVLTARHNNGQHADPDPACPYCLEGAA